MSEGLVWGCLMGKRLTWLFDLSNKFIEDSDWWLNNIVDNIADGWQHNNVQAMKKSCVLSRNGRDKYLNIVIQHPLTFVGPTNVTWRKVCSRSFSLTNDEEWQVLEPGAAFPSLRDYNVDRCFTKMYEGLASAWRSYVCIAFAWEKQYLFEIRSDQSPARAASGNGHGRISFLCRRWS